MRINRNETIILGASLAAALGSLYLSYRYLTEVEAVPTKPPPEPAIRKAKAKAKEEGGIFVPEISRPISRHPDIPIYGEQTPAKVGTVTGEILTLGQGG